MKLFIFLDVDGVLNHEPETEDCGDALRKFAGDMPLGGFSLLCPRCVDRLNQLVHFAYSERVYEDVKIVLSSTWRRYFDPKRFTELIGVAGFDFVVEDRTEISTHPRGRQIKSYLYGVDEEHRFIVLDDDVHDMGLVRSNQIVTSYKRGFDNEALDKAINLILELR